jgi:hypothetical protein
VPGAPGGTIAGQGSLLPVSRSRACCTPRPGPGPVAVAMAVAATELALMLPATSCSSFYGGVRMQLLHAPQLPDVP